MKLINAVRVSFFLLVFVYAFTSEADDKFESVSCARGFCVGNEIIATYGGPLAEIVGTIQEIRLSPWQVGNSPAIIVPKAVVKTQSGKIAEFDLRSSTLLQNTQVDKCMQVSGVKFCRGDEVVVIPDYNNGKSDLVDAKVLMIADIEGYGITNESKTQLLSIYKAQSGEEYVTAASPGLAKQGACFGRKTRACIGEKYDNGLNSLDEVLAYFPLNDEFFIKAGDMNLIASVDGQELAERKVGDYFVTMTVGKTNDEKAESSNNKDIQNARARVLRIATSECRNRFLGQGVLDLSTMNPKIYNCTQYIDKGGGGFSHGGFYGPSRRVRCEVDFTFNCVHRLKQK